MSPRIETTQSSIGTVRPESVQAASAIRTSPVQHGTSMCTTVTLRIFAWLNIAASFFT
jgi:hypothetical protein